MKFLASMRRVAAAGHHYHAICLSLLLLPHAARRKRHILSAGTTNYSMNAFLKRKHITWGDATHALSTVYCAQTVTATQQPKSTR